MKYSLCLKGFPAILPSNLEHRSRHGHGYVNNAN